MIQSFIILFREGLEISIILSIVIAATHGICGRGKFIALGIGGGLLGSAAVAFFAGELSDAVNGMGQEVFNGGVLLVAAMMIAWTTIWMQKHGRELSQKIKQIGACVREGELPLASVAVVVSLTMWREGAEIVLFMTGMLRTSTDGAWDVASGAVMGGGLAVIIGVLVYAGLLRLSNKHLFSVTGWLLMFIAAGMASAGAGYLAAADIVPTLVPELWNSSALMAEDSLPGKVLHAMLGYSERPSGIQLVFYVVTLGGILLAKRAQKPIFTPARA